MADETTTTTPAAGAPAPTGAPDPVIDQTTSISGAPTADPAATTTTAPVIDQTTSISGEVPKEPAVPETPASPETPIEYDLKLPEGVTVNEESMVQFKGLLAESKTPPEVAQKFLDMHQEALKKASTEPYDVFKNTNAEWIKTIQADPEIGGKNLGPTQASVAKLIDTLGPDQAKAFRDALAFTGAGNNPAVFRALASIAKMHTEGGFIGGKPATVETKSAAAKLYPSLN